MPKRATHKPKTPETPDEASDEGDVFDVEFIVDDRINKGKQEYLIRWLGYSASHDTWEPKENLACEDKLKLYWSNKKSSKKRKAAGLKSKASKKLKNQSSSALPTVSGQSTNQPIAIPRLPRTSDTQAGSSATTAAATKRKGKTAPKPPQPALSIPRLKAAAPKTSGYVPILPRESTAGTMTASTTSVLSSDRGASGTLSAPSLGLDGYDSLLDTDAATILENSNSSKRRNYKPVKSKTAVVDPPAEIVPPGLARSISAPNATVKPQLTRESSTNSLPSSTTISCASDRGSRRDEPISSAAAGIGGSPSHARHDARNAASGAADRKPHVKVERLHHRSRGYGQRSASRSASQERFSDYDETDVDDGPRGTAADELGHTPCMLLRQLKTCYIGSDGIEAFLGLRRINNVLHVLSRMHSTATKVPSHVYLPWAHVRNCMPEQRWKALCATMDLGLRMLVAAAEDDMRLVHKLIRKDKVDPMFGEQAPAGTALHHAASFGARRVFQHLVRNRHLRDATDDLGWTALHYLAALKPMCSTVWMNLGWSGLGLQRLNEINAQQRRHLRVDKTMNSSLFTSDFPVDKARVQYREVTPLPYSHSRPEDAFSLVSPSTACDLAKLYLDHSHVAAARARGPGRVTPIMLAAAVANVRMVNMLLKEEYRPLDEDEVGNDAMHMLAASPAGTPEEQRDRVECMKLLLGYGFRFDRPNRKGITAASYASASGNKELAKCWSESLEQARDLLEAAARLEASLQ